MPIISVDFSFIVHNQFNNYLSLFFISDSFISNCLLKAISGLQTIVYIYVVMIYSMHLSLIRPLGQPYRHTYTLYWKLSRFVLFKKYIYVIILLLSNYGFV